MRYIRGARAGSRSMRKSIVSAKKDNDIADKKEQKASGISFRDTLCLFLFMAGLYIFSMFGDMLTSPGFTYAAF